MCTWIFLLLALSPILAVNENVEDRWDSGAPEDLPLNSIFERAASVFPRMLGSLLSASADDSMWPTEHDLAVDLEDLVAELESNETGSRQCANCRALLLLIQALVKPGNGYEELRNTSIELCYAVSPPEWDPDIFCEDTMDRYAPHLIHIMNVTDKTPLEICLMWNECYKEDFNRTITKRQMSRDQGSLPVLRANAPHVRRTGRSDRELEGMLRVLHISDIHFDWLYTPGSAVYCRAPLCCRDGYEGEGEAMYWGSYPCNAPFYTAEAFLINQTMLEPDIIIFAGDAPASAHWQETQQGQLNASYTVASYIRSHFPGVPAFTTMGNHEPFPTNLYYLPRPETQELNTEMFRYWEDLSGFGEEQLRTMESAGYYSILVQPGLRLISWNSNYGYTFNFYNILHDGKAPEYLTMMEYIESELSEARQNGEKVFFIAHHYSGDHGTIDEISYTLTELLAQYGDVIVLYLLGHTHRDEFRIVPNLGSGEARVVGLAASTMGSSPNRNPEAKLFYLDPQTYTPIDADVFYVNIGLHGNADDLVVEHVYRYSEEYGMDDLTAHSFSVLAERFLSEPDTLWRYHYNLYSRYSEPDPCDLTCVIEIYCISTTSVFELERACRRDLALALSKNK